MERILILVANLKNTKPNESNTPLLSLVVPIFNVEKYLPNFLDSIRPLLHHEEMEFIFVDDGSTDDSAEILAFFLQNISLESAQVKSLSQENSGCFSARNAGLREATGRYVAFIDSDDAINPSGLLHLAKLASDAKVDICRGKYAVVRDSDWVETACPPAAQPQAPSMLLSTGKVLAREAPNIWTNVYRRNFINVNSICFQAFPRFDDSAFCFETAMKAESVLITDIHVYNYRLGRTGQDSSLTDKRLFVVNDIFTDLAIRSKNESVEYKKEILPAFASANIWAYRRLDWQLRPSFAFASVKTIFEIVNSLGVKSLIGMFQRLLELLASRAQ